MEPATLIDGLEIKLRQLANQLERQRANQDEVVAENKQLKQEIDRQSGIVNALKDKLERKELTAAKASPEAAETIDYCIKEIDRCLEWLQRD